jgi:hypothetical protein
MNRTLAVLIAVVQVSSIAGTAACAHAQAAAPFPEVRLQPESTRSHMLAYTTLVAGGLLIAGSYEFEHQADEEYTRYRAETDVQRIGTLYDRTVNLDRWANASLLAGVLMLATGVYLRFLRRPAPAHLAFTPGIFRRFATAFQAFSTVLVPGSGGPSTSSVKRFASAIVSVS